MSPTRHLDRLRGRRDDGGAPSDAAPREWATDGRDWPNREASLFVRAGGARWHVQRSGSGPALLLAHGTGASTHSWRGLAPLLARHFTVIAPDLPGHGFTERPPAKGLSLPGMAAGLTALLRELDARPAAAVGHSAGAAVLARMALDGSMAPYLLVGLNGAFLPPHGPAGRFFSPLARAFARTPLVPWLFAKRAADRAVVERLVRGTGSTLDAEGVDLYARLVRRPGHVAAALGMMAAWDLGPLARDLPNLKPRLLLVAGRNDRTIPPSQARRVRALVPGAAVVFLRGLGHLAHEERPEEVADLLTEHARRAGVPLGG